MNRLFVIIFLILSPVYAQNFSKDVILNIYGAGIYSENTNQDENAVKEDPVIGTFSQNNLFESLQGFFDNALIYGGNKRVFARGAIAGEVSYAITIDGKMIPAVTKIGDVVIRDKKKSQYDYIMDGSRFKYNYSRFKNYNNVWAEYSPRPSIKAIVVDNNVLGALDSFFHKSFYFYNPYGEKVLVKQGDYLLISLGYNVIYSMQPKDFKKIYKVYKQKN